MLVQDEQYSIEKFIELFKKKFTNFSNKSPVLINFTNTLDTVIVKEQGTNKVFTHKFDFSKSVKNNIKVIKDWLVENTYPVMIQEKKEFSDYSTVELEKLIEETGINAEEAVLLKKEKIIFIKWQINKIIVKRDELFVKNLETGKQYRYRIHMPSTIFLKKLRETWTASYAWKVFIEKTELLNEIYNMNENEE